MTNPKQPKQRCHIAGMAKIRWSIEDFQIMENPPTGRSLFELETDAAKCKDLIEYSRDLAQGRYEFLIRHKGLDDARARADILVTDRLELAAALEVRVERLREQWKMTKAYQDATEKRHMEESELKAWIDDHDPKNKRARTR